VLGKGYEAIKFEAKDRMASVAPLNWGRIVASGALAGIAGGIAFNLCLFLMSLLPAHASVFSAWQFAASAALGKSALSSPSSAWIGIALIFAASIGWGIGYAYLAHTRTAINKQPIISGFIFGVIVYVVMQFVLFSVQALKVPDIMSVYLGVLACTVFFGIPIAAAARVK
jgi:hypothetical protein